MMPDIVLQDFSKGVVLAISSEDAPKDSLRDAVNFRIGMYGSAERRTGAVKDEASKVSTEKLKSAYLFTFSSGDTVLVVSDGASIWHKTVCEGEAY